MECTNWILRCNLVFEYVISNDANEFSAAAESKNFITALATGPKFSVARLSPTDAATASEPFLKLLSTLTDANTQTFQNP